MKWMQQNNGSKARLAEISGMDSISEHIQLCGDEISMDVTVLENAGKRPCISSGPRVRSPGEHPMS